MERTLSQDERIRRAEEIYARRQNARERTSRATVNISSSKPKNFRLFKRLLLQAIICMLIYFIFYLINTTNYSFSKVTLDKTEELITHEVDFISIYNNIVDAITNYISNLNLGSKNNVDEGIISNENTINENSLQNNEINENIIENSEISDREEQNIAILNNEEDTVQEEVKDIEVSQTDRIKQKYSFIVPVKRMDFI